MFRSLRTLARLVRILLSLARHDALFPLDRTTGAAPFLRITRLIRRRGPGAASRPGERLAAALTEMGPSFIKLGQILSTRADLLGDEITEDLALLQDRLPPFSGHQARALVEVEMDLRFEAAAASELAENFAGDSSFRVPRIDWLRTGRTVLTTERIAGIRVDDRETLLAAGHSIDDLLSNAAGAFFKQVFRD